MGLGTMLGGAAVKELLRLSPQILTAAEQVYSTVTRNRQAGAETGLSVLSRLNSLEAVDLAQAELLEQMAGQLKTLSLAMEQLTLNTKRLTILAGGAGALALLGIILLLARW
jgi:hypothetical protein